MSGSGPPSPSSPLLGTEWLEAQLASLDRGLAAHEPESTTEGSSPPKLQSLCSDISEFRRQLQRYRKLDDSINLSINRSFILLDSPRQTSQSSSTQCQGFWNMLTASWLSRENLIRSCIDVVDRSVQERNDAIHRLSMDPTDPKNVPPLSSSKTKSQLEAEVYNAELKRRMIHDELTVESTIRKQTIQKFRTRCPESFFSIPADSPPTQLDPHPSSTSPAQ
ncbi:hypothetical protein MJO28_012521 [Puccinia striiformis f. sp. tritici]|uniref:Uncharacterized protein n=1 Tax=Puccinia striiformis f. sp. tritici TaxID=168172 RepID=A0ACC0E244_9BASI|nr:hypothetical protein Pst134EA_022586 [Puccinia striiformis f. sp. tritici]KAH9455110.1 hypothetical protein Pst134EA_022586 [Puccinia striiformis f. sp. tritici]KAI7942494.1 hypothetical protein MJO28_012521 [Puccinia striiformis f. sp. tritici]KAI7945521.1 hypothetical protein MJO29_011909 [Puccinia striiformis f. sp. tritici]